jgi:hypothetical protein
MHFPDASQKANPNLMPGTALTSASLSNKKFRQTNIAAAVG